MFKVPHTGLSTDFLELMQKAKNKGKAKKILYSTLTKWDLRKIGKFLNRT